MANGVRVPTGPHTGSEGADSLPMRCAAANRRRHYAVGNLPLFVLTSPMKSTFFEFIR